MRALFVAPHFDDVALSCGGTVARHAMQGDHPVVVTITAAIPDSPLAGSATPTEIREYVTTRRQEDAAAVRLLGATAIWLPYLDAIFRGHRDVRESAEPEPRILQQVGDDLASLWRRTPNALVFLPAGIGNHVDHQLCASVHTTLRTAGAAVWHYEDVPYVIQLDALQKRIDAIRLAPVRTPGAPYLAQRLASMGYAPRLVDVTPYMDRRLDAIACYASQLPALFPRQDYRAVVSRYAGSVADEANTHAERFWTCIDESQRDAALAS